MNKTIATDFRKRLKMWRIARHMTQRDLSLKCAITEQGISAIEAGTANARTSTMVDIIQNGFEMSYEQFFVGAIPQRNGARVRERMSGVPVPNLRKYRVLAELTTYQLATKVGVTPATINHIENGGYASPALAHRIAHVFDGGTLEDMTEVQIVHAEKDDMAADFLEGKSIKRIADDLIEDHVKPLRQAAAQKKLDAEMERQGISRPTPPKSRAKARLTEADVMVSSQADILAWLQADVQKKRDGVLEEEVEEE